MTGSGAATPPPASEPSPASPDRPVRSDYAQWYYSHCCGKPYDVTDPGWLEFFGTIADRIVETVAPGTALDAGCAMGILVGSLRERGVDAEGVDLSEYAIGRGDPRAAGHLRVGDLVEPLPGRYDVISCIEVLEHIEAGTVERVIGNLCAATDSILLSTTPEDFNEGTHVNVRPPSYWLALFADQGFFRRFDVDASFVSPWAVLLERRTAPPHRLVAEYETQLWDLRRENRGARAALIARDRRLSELGDTETLKRELRQASDRAASAERQLAEARAEARRATREARAVRTSRGYKLGSAVLAPLGGLRRLTGR